MLKVEYDVLSFVMENEGCQWIDIINHFDPQSRCRITDAILSCLLDAKLIKASAAVPLCSVRLTPDGFLAVESYKQDAKEKAEEKRERRKDQILSAIIALVSTAFGAVLTAFL